MQGQKRVSNALFETLAFVVLPEIKISRQFLEYLDALWKLESFFRNTLNKSMAK